MNPSIGTTCINGVAEPGQSPVLDAGCQTAYSRLPAKCGVVLLSSVELQLLLAPSIQPTNGF